MIWVPVRCPEGASGGELIQICSNGESKLHESDDASCTSVTSSSYSSMEGLPPTLAESVVPELILPAPLPPELVVPESILPGSLPPELVVP